MQYIYIYIYIYIIKTFLDVHNNYCMNEESQVSNHINLIEMQRDDIAEKRIKGAR